MIGAFFPHLYEGQEIAEKRVKAMAEEVVVKEVIYI